MALNPRILEITAANLGEELQRARIDVKDVAVDGDTLTMTARRYGKDGVDVPLTLQLSEDRTKISLFAPTVRIKDSALRTFSAAGADTTPASMAMSGPNALVTAIQDYKHVSTNPAQGAASEPVKKTAMDLVIEQFGRALSDELNNGRNSRPVAFVVTSSNATTARLVLKPHGSKGREVPVNLSLGEKGDGGIPVRFDTGEQSGVLCKIEGGLVSLTSFDFNSLNRLELAVTGADTAPEVGSRVAPAVENFSSLMEEFEKSTRARWLALRSHTSGINSEACLSRLGETDPSITLSFNSRQTEGEGFYTYFNCEALKIKDFFLWEVTPQGNKDHANNDRRSLDLLGKISVFMRGYTYAKN